MVLCRLPSAPSFDRSNKPDYADYRTASFGRSGLRTVVVPNKVMSHFLNLALKNTLNNIETCGILAGKLVWAVRVRFVLIVIVFLRRETN